ncbi:MAG: MFS transporter [Acidobacteriaceae bacterium]|nr:MFS transporter [Acidobacteriaceae bacterium]
MHQSETAVTRETHTSSATRFRWFICGLLFYATTVNYMDRMVLGILKPTIAHDLGWSETQYGLINSAFQLGYAIMMPVAGRIIDWVGLRVGYTLAVLFWSISSMCHALAGNAIQFSLARLGLGLGEASNFPAAIKTVAEWFPQNQRSLATGIFNSGSNIGAVLAPLAVPLITAHFGWHAAFLVTGTLSMSWAFVWFFTYRDPEKHPKVNKQELTLIRSGSDAAPSVKLSYPKLLSKRSTWAFVLGKFITDPVWWFYLYWIPGFLQLKYKVDLIHLGPPLVTIYVLADVGSIGGGWLSSHLMRLGWTAGGARKTAMLVCAVCVVSVMFVPAAAGNLWLTVALISIAAASHQGWSANLFTVVSDCFPRSAVASVIGLGGLGGAIGGMLAQPAIGRWLDLSHEHYSPLFWVGGSAYLFALLIIHLLLPRFERVDARN